MFFDEGFHRGAVFFQKPSNQEKPHAARQDRGNGKDNQIKVNNAACDGDYFVRERRNTGNIRHPETIVIS